MGQAEIMEFLDKFPGKYFSTKQIHAIFSTHNITTIARCMPRIVKREEYGCIIKCNVRGPKRRIILYGRIKENGKH